MKLEAEQTLTWEDLDAWNQAYMLNSPQTGGTVRSAETLLQIWGLLLALIGACALAVNAYSHRYGMGVVFPAAVIVVGGLFFFPVGIRKRVSRKPKNKILAEAVRDQFMRVVFREDGIHARIGEQERSWPYCAVSCVWEDRERLYFLPKEGHPPLLILRKSAFPQSALEELPGFLTEKTGRPVETIK